MIKRLLFVILLCSIASAAQVMQISVGNTATQGPPAGTAPTFGTATGCATGGTTCNGATTLNVTAGDTVGCIEDGSTDGVSSCTDSVGDSFVCTSYGSMHIGILASCFDLTSAGGATVTMTCANTTNTNWTACIFFTIHCSSTCVIEQAANYAVPPTITCVITDCTGTTVTTAYQQNELAIAGWGTNQVNVNVYSTNGDWTVPSGGTINNGGAKGSAGVSYKTLMTTGAATGKVTIDTSIPDGFTMAFR